MKLYRFIDVRGNLAAINFSVVGDMSKRGDGVLVRWGSEATVIPDTTVEELLQWIEESV